MRHWFIIGLLGLSGCNSASETGSELPRVRQYNGDPANFTASGFARFSYPVDECNVTLPLEAPFQVSEAGYGDPSIRVPIEILSNPAVKDMSDDGVNSQNRISYALPSIYRGEGMLAWLKSSNRIRPITSLPNVLRSSEAQMGNGAGGETHFAGNWTRARKIAIICTAIDWPNPTCAAEVETTKGGMNYLVTFPPKAAGKLARMIAIGDKLFEPVIKVCHR